MKPVPLSWAKNAAWLVFIELILLASWMWILIYQEKQEFVFGPAFSFFAIISYPNLNAGGWGLFKGWNLCRNRPTFLVALGIHLLFVVSQVSAALGNHGFDELFALGIALPGMLLVRTYIDMKPKPTDSNEA